MTVTTEEQIEKLKAIGSICAKARDRMAATRSSGPPASCVQLVATKRGAVVVTLRD